MSSKILIVEDESLVALEIASALKKAGYIILGTVTSSIDAFSVIAQELPDLIMMDINIDGPIDGIGASRQIQTVHNVPIVFLTAYNDKATIDKAIETSPAGYLIKPFKRQELYAAVALAMAKNTQATPKQIVLSKECVYYPDISELIKLEAKTALTKKEKQLLDLLLSYKNTLVSFETIEYALWPDKTVSTTTRRTLIHRLREKVGEQSIKTIKDQGCMLTI